MLEGDRRALVSLQQARVQITAEVRLLCLRGQRFGCDLPGQIPTGLRAFAVCDRFVPVGLRMHGKAFSARRWQI